MDVIDCIKTRRSIRKFSSKPVEWDKVGTIIDCGRLAPSAGNLQNWKFTVVLNRERRVKIAEACLQQHWIHSAPVIIIVTAEPKKSERFYGVRGDRLYSIQNCAAAVENMLLTAHSLGLASCWVGAFDEEMLKRAVGISSDDVRPQAVVPIGYAGEVVPEPPKQPIITVTYLESYGNRISDPNEYLGYTSSKVQGLIKKGKEALEKVARKAAKK